MDKEEIMQIRNEIKSYIAKSGKSLKYIVDEMNKSRVDIPPTGTPKKEGVLYKTTPQNISNKLTRGTLRYKEAKEIVDIIGYKIKWIKEAE